jgi:hypothetical protein
MNQEFTFTGIAALTLTHVKGTNKSQHVDTKFTLEVSNNLKKENYIDANGLPVADGIKALSLAFIHGLAGNIHYAHQNNIWDSAQHLRFIIDELTRAFATVADVDTAYLDDGKEG